MNAGDISLILGIASLAFIALYFFLPFSLILAIASGIVAIVTGHRARKKDPANKNAKIGKLLGWITAGLIKAFFIALIIAFASIGSWRFGLLKPLYFLIFFSCFFCFIWGKKPPPGRPPRGGGGC